MVEGVAECAVGCDGLEHLQLRRAERIVAPPLGDVARYSQQLDDHATIGDRRYDDVPPSREHRRRAGGTLKSSAAAAARRRNGLLRHDAMRILVELVERSIPQGGYVGHFEEIEALAIHVEDTTLEVEDL